MVLSFLKNYFICIVVYTLLHTSCSENPIKKFSNASTNEAIYEDAMKLYNNGQFTESIQKFAQLSPQFLNQREVRFNYAKALAGKCGYTFIDFISAVSSANFGGSNTFFQTLLSLWGNKHVLPTFCTQAEAQVKIIWSQLNSPSERTTSEKFFMALISLAKMGMYMRVKFDIAENSGLGNGVVDTGVNSCTNSPNPLFFSDAEIKEIITGFALFVENLTAIGTALANLSSITGLTNGLCSYPGVTFCSVTDAANVTSAQVTQLRKLLRSSSTGLDGVSCVPIIPPDNCCP
ncbi:MAG: hypothetical protein NZ480_09300 [Bdellovibrionaceae bacterium]|nr:hypothetical protein [Pseudobdellovibrionaceae bacterium]MDW8189744.1 hypothetical protein [Pseudobdellovibrionaceae bacterium]